MKQRTVLVAILLAICGLTALNATTTGKVQVKFEEKLTFSEESNLKKASFFCATEDGLLVIPDKGAQCVKIFEKNGKELDLSKTIGENDGKGQFEELTSCFYRESVGQLAFFDAQKSKVFLYDRIGRLEFQPYKEIVCLRRARDINIFDGQLIVSAYNPDSNLTPYDLYANDIDNGITTYLLESWFKYGLNDIKEYIEEYREKPDFKARGISGWFDVDTDGNIYYVWEGDINTLQKINIKTGMRTPLGSSDSDNGKFEYYVKHAKYLDEFREAHKKKDVSVTQRVRTKVSYVTDIFVNDKYIFLVYEGASQKSRSRFRLQVYTLDGKFFNDVPIPGNPGKNMYLDKKNDILYSLSSQKSGKQKYSILKYKIEFVK